MSIFYTFPYKNSADDFSPTLFIIEPVKSSLDGDFFCEKIFFIEKMYI